MPASRVGSSKLDSRLRGNDGFNAEDYFFFFGARTMII
jgi:hypothetical protein